MGWPMTTQERYERDPVFRRPADMILVLLHDDGLRTFTPSDVREAANHACFLYEITHMRTPFFKRNLGASSQLDNILERPTSDG